MAPEGDQYIANDQLNGVQFNKPLISQCQFSLVLNLSRDQSYEETRTEGHPSQNKVFERDERTEYKVGLPYTLKITRDIRPSV